MIFTLLNAPKPLHVDDAAYYYYAAHIAAHPFDPYHFEVFWYETLDPANEVLAPPVLPYWWAAAIRLFGERPVLWKLWLFPFAGLLTLALFRLYRRFARGLEMPLLCMTLLSPGFLPSLNLMLDVPALALSLTAVVLFFDAVEDCSRRRAVLAGLVAGLAMQTKYTAFLGPAVMVLYGATRYLLNGTATTLQKRRHILLSLIAAAAAGLVFLAWEGFVAWRYGTSHFWYHFRQNDAGLLEKISRLTLPLPVLVGSVAAPGVLLGLAALERRRWALGTAAVLLVSGYLAALVSTWSYSLRTDLVPITPGQVIFFLFGLALAVVTAEAARRLLRLRKGGWLRPAGRRRPADWFLVLWLALEVAGYFVLSPFPAVRRVLGVVVVVTLILGRLASRTCRSGQRAAWVRVAAVGTVALGTVYYAVDLREATARKELAEHAAAFIHERDPGRPVWFVGHWGFQYYAERLRMKPIIPGRSQLRRGDWVVVPQTFHVDQQSFPIDPEELEEVETLAVSDWIPLTTGWDFYGTVTGVPLQRRTGPRAEATLYRAKKDFTASK